MLPRLGVNIDHVATLRQLRDTSYPSLIQAARLVERAGAHQLTVHLREDRRHVQDEDVRLLKSTLEIPLNLEMAATDEMCRFAVRVKPAWVCLVPEKRREVTTEGGLDLRSHRKRIDSIVGRLRKANIRVSFFVEPNLTTVRFGKELGADALEFHTGRYCRESQRPASKANPRVQSELNRIKKAALLAKQLGIHPHAGHGFDFDNVRRVVELDDEKGAPLIEEYNIGHAIVCRSVMVGLEQAVREMLSSIQSP